MEKKSTIKENKTEEISENQEIQKKDKKIFKAVLVDTTDVMKEKAIDTGDTKMTIEPPKNPEDLKGFKKFFKQEFWSQTGKLLWRHGMARDYFRNTEIGKASKEILKTGNLFVGEGKDKATSDKFVSDIIEQFSAESDQMVHKLAGEEKLKNTEIPEGKEAKESIKKIIKEYAKGNISIDAFESQEKRIFSDLKSKVEGKKIKEHTMHASNLIEVAEQLKVAMAHKEFLENEDFDIDLIYGKSKAGLRTEEQFNKAEEVINKLLHTKVGQFTNDTSIVLALSCASRLFTSSLIRLPGKIIPVLGAATIGSAFAKGRKGVEVEQKRKEHFKKMTLDEERLKYDPDRMPARKNLEEFRYQMDSSENMTNTLVKNIELLERNESKLTPEMINGALADLSKIEGRILLSDRRKVDLVTYSNSQSVVKERMDIDIEIFKLKTKLQDLHKTGKFSVPAGQTFEEHLSSLSSTQETALLTEKDVGIESMDRNFNKMKSKEKWKAAWKSFKMGVIIGGTAQEVFYLADGLWGGENISLTEDIIHQIKGDEVLEGVGPHQMSMLTYAEHYLRGDFPKVGGGELHELIIGENHINLPKGVDMIKNTEGSYNLMNGDKVLVENFANSDGSLTDSANNFIQSHGISLDQNSVVDGVQEQTINSEDFVEKNPNLFEEMKTRIHLENNTPESNLNELRTVWGGLNGTGMDADGTNYILNISRMTTDGSFHNDLSANAQELMESGKMEVLFTLSNETGKHIIPLLVTPDGNIKVPVDSELGKILFANTDGQAELLAKYAEIATDTTGSNDYQILSTVVGHGVDGIVEEVPKSHIETVLNVPADFDYNIWYMPAIPGEPNEKLSKEKQKISEDDDINDIVNPEIVPDVVDPVVIIKPDVIPEVVPGIEISQEEYAGMKDDLKMINRKIQSSEGIVTLEESDFKSSHGKKRYNELKHIPDGKPVTFNRSELMIIGDEMERVLSTSKKAMTSEEKAQKSERDIFAEYEKFVEENPNEKIPEEMEERYRNAEKLLDYEKAKKEEADIFGEFKKFTEENPAEEIPEEMEERYRKAEERLNLFKEKSKIETPEQKKKDQIEKTKEEIEKNFDVITQNEEETKNNNENIAVSLENTLEKEELFTFKDLSKFGTEFESKDFTFKTISTSKTFFGPRLIIVEGIDKNTNKKELYSYREKDLKKALEKKEIKINKIIEE